MAPVTGLARRIFGVLVPMTSRPVAGRRVRQHGDAERGAPGGGRERAVHTGEGARGAGAAAEAVVADNVEVARPVEGEVAVAAEAGAADRGDLTQAGLGDGVEGEDMPGRAARGVVVDPVGRVDGTRHHAGRLGVRGHGVGLVRVRVARDLDLVVVTLERPDLAAGATERQRVPVAGAELRADGPRAGRGVDGVHLSVVELDRVDRVVGAHERRIVGVRRARGQQRQPRPCQ